MTHLANNMSRLALVNSIKNQNQKHSELRSDECQLDVGQFFLITKPLEVS